MGGNQTVKDGSPLGQIPEGTDLVGSHQSAVSLDVSRKNRDQPALCIGRFRQITPLDPTGSVSRTKWHGTSKIGVNPR